MKQICAWCKKVYGEKEGDGETHGFCERCYRQQQAAIAKIRREQAALTRQCAKEYAR